MCHVSGMLCDIVRQLRLVAQTLLVQSDLLVSLGGDSTGTEPRETERTARSSPEKQVRSWDS